MIQTFYPEKDIRNYNYKQQNQASKTHQEIHPHFDELLHIVHVYYQHIQNQTPNLHHNIQNQLSTYGKGHH